MENESFEQLYNESLKNDVILEKRVKGKIIEITSQGEIFVDLGYKADGIIPRKEYSFDIEDNPTDEFKVGDEITAEILKMNDGLGNVLLSYKKLKLSQSREKFSKMIADGKVFETKIKEINEKGIVTEVYGIRVFIPISLSGISKNDNLEQYKGQKITFKIVEYEPENRKIIGSHRILVDEEKQKRELEFWNSIDIGKEYIGTVAAISSYGAFVELGVIQGLLHVSEITWRRNANVSDYLKVGQEIKVVVKELDKDNKKVKLSYPLKEINPWEKVSEKYALNDIVNVTVKNMVQFGVFVELEEGVEGLVHISQICDERIAKPEDKLELGQKVDAKIINFDVINKKIELSIREAQGVEVEE